MNMMNDHMESENWIIRYEYRNEYITEGVHKDRIL